MIYFMHRAESARIGPPGAGFPVGSDCPHDPVLDIPAPGTLRLPGRLSKVQGERGAKR